MQRGGERLKKREKWIVCKDFPRYQVSNMGRVRNKRFMPPKILTYQLNERGYYRVCLYAYGNIRRYVYVHKLVWESWKGRTNKAVGHKNHNRLDNRLSNLLVVDDAETSFRRYMLRKEKIDMYGEDNEYICTYKNIKQATSRTKFDINDIVKCVYGDLLNIDGFIFKKKL